MDDNKEKLTAKFAKMDQNFFNPVCLWHIQQTTIAYFVYWPAQSLTKINYCCSTRVFYWTIKAANICSGILLLSFLAFQLFGPPKCLWSSYHGSRGSRFQGPWIPCSWVRSCIHVKEVSTHHFSALTTAGPKEGQLLLAAEWHPIGQKVFTLSSCNMLVNDKVHNLKDYRRMFYLALQGFLYSLNWGSQGSFILLSKPPNLGDLSVESSLNQSINHLFTYKICLHS